MSDSLVLAMVFVGSAVLAYFLIGAPLVALLQAQPDESKLTDYDRVRQRTFLGRIRPILGYVALKSEKIAFLRRYLAVKSLEWGPQLIQAGQPANLTAHEFGALKLCAPVVAVAFIGLGFQIADPLILLFAGAFAFFMPDMWLNDLAKKRQQMLSRHLPDALDTLSLVIGAGADFGQALQIYTEGSATSPLAEEFSIARNEMLLGVSRVDALQAMSVRVNSESITKCITAMIQSEKMGTALAETLTSISEDLKGRRFEMADRLGQQASIQMIGPLMFLILPNIFLIIFTPMVLQFYFPPN
jgi:tight adherence protein C